MLLKFFKSIGLAAIVGVAAFGLSQAGSLEPSAPPGPTMKTLDQIPPTWSQALSASERFELVLKLPNGIFVNGGGVLDKETGLVWHATPEQHEYDEFGVHRAWDTCIRFGAGRLGWRLPALEEIQTLGSAAAFAPFNVMDAFYWTATTSSDGVSAYLFNPRRADLHRPIEDGPSPSPHLFPVMCVRGGAAAGTRTVIP